MPDPVEITKALAVAAQFDDSEPTPLIGSQRLLGICAALTVYQPETWGVVAHALLARTPENSSADLDLIIEHLVEATADA